MIVRAVSEVSDEMRALAQKSFPAEFVPRFLTLLRLVPGSEHARRFAVLSSTQSDGTTLSFEKALKNLAEEIYVGIVWQASS